MTEQPDESNKPSKGASFPEMTLTLMRGEIHVTTDMLTQAFAIFAKQKDVADIVEREARMDLRYPNMDRLTLEDEKRRALMSSALAIVLNLTITEHRVLCTLPEWRQYISEIQYGHDQLLAQLDLDEEDT